MFAAIADGHAELAEVFLLVATVLAAVSMAVAVVRGAVEAALLPAAVGFLSLALFVL